MVSPLYLYNIDLKIRNYRDSSKDKKKDEKSKPKNLSLNTLKLLSNTQNIQKYEFDSDLKSNSFANRTNHAKLADWINMISVETNYNELKYSHTPAPISQTPSSFFDYEKLKANNKNIRATPKLKLMGKSSSMVSLKCKEVELCRSETKPEFYQTPIAKKKEPKFHQTLPKDNSSSCHLTSLDQNISAVLQKLKTISSRGTEKKANKRGNARSWWSTIDGERTDSVSSFISYKKNKYSVTRQPEVKKSDDKENKSIEIATVKAENKFADYINNIKNSSIRPKTVIEITENHDIILSNQGTSEGETCEKDTDEGHESEGYIAENSLHSSNVTDSYQSFSTMQQERSECMDIHEKEYTFFDRPTTKLKNPFL